MSMQHLVFLCFCASLVACSSVNKAVEDGTKELTIEKYHGYNHSDKFEWLESKEEDGNPTSDVFDLIQNENKTTSDFFDKHSGLLEKIYKEISSRRLSEPFSALQYESPLGSYYTAPYTGSSYPTRYFQPNDSETAFLLLDDAKRAEGLAHYKVLDIAVSPAGKNVAWIEDITGDLVGNLYIRSLSNENEILDQIDSVSGSFSWGKSDDEIYYVNLDDKNRTHQVIKRVISTGEEKIIFTEHDPQFYLYLVTMASGEGVLIESVNWTTNETLAVWFNASASEPMMITSRKEEADVSVQHFDGRFVAHKTGKNISSGFYISEMEERKPSNWKRIYSDVEQDVNEVEFFNSHIIFTRRGGGIDTLWKLSLSTLEVEQLSPPETMLGINMGMFTQNPFGSEVKLQVQSFLQPKTVLTVALIPQDRLVLSNPNIPQFDPDIYSVRREYVESHDGVMVPVTLIGLKEKMNGQSPSPVYQYVYGAYGIGITPEFPAFALSLIDRGFIYAVSHVRGGNENGDIWHQQGRLLNRQNTHKDFVAISEWLVEEGIAAPHKGISISGESAAGITIGAALNTHSHLYMSATALVPFIDTLNRLLNPDFFLTQYDWSEFGNPLEDKVFFEYIREYSAIENMKRQDYPSSYLTGSLDDYGVGYWEPLKWTLAVREQSTSVDSINMVQIRAGGHIASDKNVVNLDFARQMTFMAVMHSMEESLNK